MMNESDVEEEGDEQVEGGVAKAGHRRGRRRRPQ